MADIKEQEIDDNLYSRQRYVLGDQAMKSMAKSNVLISGLNGTGVEIAKNIALAGVKSLTLHDTKAASWTDLSTQFYLQVPTLGKNRAEVSLAQISELNPYTKVSVSTASLTDDLSWLDQFKVVILCDSPLAQQKIVNEYCHAHGIAFIASSQLGAFLSIFVDFGESHEVNDVNGEEPKEILITHISNENPAVATNPNVMHGLEDGDNVKFREVKGMESLNSGVYEVKVLSPHSFALVTVDGTQLPTWEIGSGALATEVKKRAPVSFATLASQLVKPDLLFADFGKFEAPAQLHLGFQAVHAFAAANAGAWPKPWNADDAAAVLKFAEEINGAAKLVEQIDTKAITRLSYTAAGSLVGLTSFAGGVLAQEALKAITGKYTPIKQWLFLDAAEVVPALESPAADFAPRGDRSDGQRIVLGQPLIERLAQTRLFMIGAGAIGCEMLKNYAMMGVATDLLGKITVTDNDLIEMSNLNRQFLFRRAHIQKPKSKSAADMVLAMNPDLHIDAELDRVGQETEDKYGDNFFQELDVVVNALDNVAARLYVDQRCVTNQRPLLESGTLGTKGHVQVIVPHLTESYGSTRDPPEKDVPFCTLKSFPSAIEHCIEWARDFSFESLFVNKANLTNDMFEPGALAALDSSKMRDVKVANKLLKTRPTTFDDCVRFGRQKFQTYYYNSMMQLLYAFPLDMKTKEGTPFWAAPKRPPTPQIFNAADPAHLEFVTATAALLADMWGLKRPSRDELLSADSQKHIAEIAGAWQPAKPWEPKNKKIETDEAAKKPDETAGPSAEQLGEEFERQYQTAKEALMATVAQGKVTLVPADFEKDDDRNSHIDFVTAAANLRARVYGIQEAERLKVKRIAGRIIPAIATTTAAVSGLVSIELIKILLKAPLEHYKSCFLNLGISMFALSEPATCPKTPITEKVSHTLWDRWEFKGDITLQQFVDHFKDKYDLTVTGVFQGVTMVFVPMLGHGDRLPDLLRQHLKLAKGQKYTDLIVSFENEAGDDVNGPVVRFYPQVKRAAPRKKPAAAAAATEGDDE